MKRVPIVVAAILSAVTLDAAVLRRGGFDIVIPPKASKVVEFAAKELQTFLAQSLGGEAAIARRPSDGLVHVYLGDSPEARAAGVDVAAFRRDEFAIRVVGDSIFIAGRDDATRDPAKEVEKGATMGQMYERATLFGAYEFLERFAGCRFYFPGELGTVVPNRDAIEVGECDLRVAPYMRLRRPYSGGGADGYDGAWFDDSMKPHRGKSLNWLRLRFSTENIPCCHGLNGFGYLRRFAKSHPEFFALHTNGSRDTDASRSLSGQLCLSSGIWEEIYQDVKSYLSGEGPEVRGVVNSRNGRLGWSNNCVDRKYVDVMFQDGMFQCQCQNCQKAYNRGPEFKGNWATGIAWSNTVKIARRLMADGVPGYITQMAYCPYNIVPEIDIPTNVLVMVAVGGPWTIRRPNVLEGGLSNIRAWSEKLKAPVWIWTYPGKFSSQPFPGIPQVTPNAIGSYYKMAAPWIFGTFMESESDRFLYNYFNYYMLSRVTWDAGTDVDAVIAEHHRLMFGAAADDMAKFYSTLEDKWLGHIMGNVVDTALGPQTTPPTNAKLWGEIYSAEVVAGLDRLLDDAAGKVPPDSLEARRIALFRREFLGGLKTASERFKKHSDAVKSLVWEPGKGGLALDHLFGKYKAGGVPEKVKTVVSMENGADSLTFTFECEEPSTEKTVAMRRSHDDSEIWRDNGVEIFLNTSADKLTFYHFLVNSAGSFSDSKCVKPGIGFPKADYNWESGAKVKVSVGDGRWTAVVEIPKSALGEIAPRFPAEFLRTRNVSGEVTSYFNWSPYSRGIDELENMGTLVMPSVKGHVSTSAEIAEQVASDMSRPVRQGGIAGQAFWNGRSVVFMHPPAFDFANVPGAVRYRYSVLAADGKTREFEEQTPKCSLAAVWMELPEGMTSLEVCGLDEDGRVVGKSGSRRFWKSAAFSPESCPAGVRGYAESARLYFDWLFEMPNTKSYLERGVPDECYPYNTYPSKTDSAVVNAFVSYAKLRPDRKDAALTVARRAADHLLSLTFPPGSPLEHFPHTYRVLNPPNGFPPKDQGANKIAKQYQGQVMMVYPAIAGRALMNLFNVIGDGKYRDAAVRIAETYLKLQGEDGTWHLKVRGSDGQPVAPNRLFPLVVCEFLEDVYKVTGEVRFRVASDRAFAFVEKGPLADWNWEAQFEDVAPSRPYRNLTIHTPVATALHLLKRYPSDMKRRDLARECMRFAEDQFVLWRPPFGPDGTGPLSEGTDLIPVAKREGWFDVPVALEQYDWYLPIDSAAAKMIKGYLALYRAEGRAVDLAKARALGDAITIMQQKHGKGGGFPTHWTTMEVGSDMSPWINCGIGTARTLMALADVVDGCR